MEVHYLVEIQQLTESHISPLEMRQNYAQKLESGDSGDSGGFIVTLDKNGNIKDGSHPLSDRYVAFDFEWSSGVEQPEINNNPTQITAGSIRRQFG